MKENHRKTSKGFNRRVERLLLQLTIFGLAAIVFFQILLTNDNLRHLLSYSDKLEGEKVDESVPVFSAGSNNEEKTGLLTIALADGKARPGTELLVNGFIVGRFTKPQITVTVYDRDILEIDSLDGEKNLRLVVSYSSPNIVIPARKGEYVTKSSKDIICEVKIED